MSSDPGYQGFHNSNPTSRLYDNVTINAMSTRLPLVTKYGLRLHVSHDGTVEISYVPDPLLKRKIIPGDVNGCNLELPTLNAVTPVSNGFIFIMTSGMLLWYWSGSVPEADEDLAWDVEGFLLASTAGWCVGGPVWGLSSSEGTAGGRTCAISNGFGEG